MREAVPEKRAMTKKTEGGPTHPPVKAATRLVAGGRDATANHGFVNPPVYHASTVLYPTAGFPCPPVALPLRPARDAHLGGT